MLRLTQSSRRMLARTKNNVSRFTAAQIYGADNKFDLLFTNIIKLCSLVAKAPALLWQEWRLCKSKFDRYFVGLRFMCSFPTMQTGSFLRSATGFTDLHTVLHTLWVKGTKQNAFVSCNPQTTCVECKTLIGFLLSQTCPFSLWGLWYVHDVQQNKTCFRFQQLRSLFLWPPLQSFLPHPFYL